MPPIITTGRRPALELPFAAAGGGPATAPAPDAPAAEPDLDLHSGYDVPAFLRRQEG